MAPLPEIHLVAAVVQVLHGASPLTAGTISIVAFRLASQRVTIIPGWWRRTAVQVVGTLRVLRLTQRWTAPADENVCGLYL